MCHVVRLIIVNLLALLLMACDGQKQDDQSAFGIQNVHMNALPPGRSTAAVYLSLINNTDADQVLSYVHSPHAEAVEVHRNFYEEGMMRMRPVRHTAVPAGETLHFKPGGYHLMLMGIDKDFRSGESFPLTLEFNGGMVREVLVSVK